MSTGTTNNPTLANQILGTGNITAAPYCPQKGTSFGLMCFVSFLIFVIFSISVTNLMWGGSDVGKTSEANDYVNRKRDIALIALSLLTFFLTIPMTYWAAACTK